MVAARVDQPVGAWRRLLTVHPAQCESESATCRNSIAAGRGPVA